MKVALIFPRFKHRNFASEPLGLLYIAGALRGAGIEATLFDGTVMEKGDIVEGVSKGGFSFAGFSIQTIFYEDALQIARDIKRKNPAVKIVFGGPHANLSNNIPSWVDYVVIGEGEKAFIDIAKGRMKGRIIKAGPISDMDKLPTPARDILPSCYFAYGAPNFMLSRGCPYNCAFCQPTLRSIFGNKCRKFSAKRSIDEIKSAISEYERRGVKVKKYVFQDDAVTYDKKWLVEFCRLLIDEGMALTWVAGSRADTLPDNRTLELMKESGCSKLSIGVESGNDHIRNDILKKGLSRDRIIDAFKRLKEAGIEAHSFLMIGSPDETPLTVLDTVKLLDEINPSSAQVTVTTPIPGTGLYDYCANRRILDVNSWSDYDYYFDSHIRLGMDKKETNRYRNAVNYAIIFRSFLKKRFGITVSHKVLFFVFKISLVNKFISSFERGRFNGLRQSMQRASGFSMKK